MFVFPAGMGDDHRGGDEAQRARARLAISRDDPLSISDPHGSDIDRARSIGVPDRTYLAHQSSIDEAGSVALPGDLMQAIPGGFLQPAHGLSSSSGNPDPSSRPHAMPCPSDPIGLTGEFPPRRNPAFPAAMPASAIVPHMMCEIVLL